MEKILFVCHGNICRSPMAEFIMKSLVGEKGLSDKFEIQSAATSTEEIGNGIYPPAQRVLKAHGIVNASHQARQITKEDYNYFDLIIGMDSYNIRNILRFFDNDPEGKVIMLNKEPVDDPWYTDDFATAYNKILSGCKNLLRKLND